MCLICESTCGVTAGRISTEKEVRLPDESVSTAYYIKKFLKKLYNVDPFVCACGDQTVAACVIRQSCIELHLATLINSLGLKQRVSFLQVCSLILL